MTRSSSSTMKQTRRSTLKASSKDKPKAHAPPTPMSVDGSEQELIPPQSRLSRRPSTVPETTSPSSSTPSVAIPAQTHTTTSSTGQDVHFSVNASPASQNIGQPSTPLEPTGPSYPQPLTQHGLKHPIRRPRTSTVFNSSSELAAHYGIPQILPPAPRATSQPTTTQPTQSSDSLADYHALCSSYLNMLSDKPTVNQPASASSMMPPPAPPSGLGASLAPEQWDEIAQILTSPEFTTNDSFDEYNNFINDSPALSVGVSPFDTPFDDFLNTPLIEDGMLTSPDMADMNLFPDVDPSLPLFPTFEDHAAPQSAINVDVLMKESPHTPLLQDFTPSAKSAPATRSSTSSTAPSTSTRRRTLATGIRKGVTPDSLLDESAPTQPRKYTTPSATSRKEVPAVFARKRARSTAFGDEEDQLDELPPNPTERDLIDAKRRQNTIAARRSRKRKMEQYQALNDAVSQERELHQKWKQRALALHEFLAKQGMPLPAFPEDPEPVVIPS